MKTVFFTMLALGLALSVVPAGAQGQTSFTIQTNNEASSGYFTLEGETAKNPTLNVAPGAMITITLKGVDDGFHNFCVDGAEPKCSEYVESGADTQTFMFTAPASGKVEYFCQPHRGAGMKGTVNAASATATPENVGGETNDTPGFELAGALVALAGVALIVARRR